MKEVRIYTYPSYFESQREVEFMASFEWGENRGKVGGRWQMIEVDRAGGRKLNMKYHLPRIWAVATKQSIILPFQEIKVTYLKSEE